MATKSQPAQEKGLSAPDARPAESAEAYVRALMKQGVRVSVLVGGLPEWIKQGGPTEGK